MITIENFEAWELVDPYIYAKYGEASLQFIDPRLKKWIEWFRNRIDLPVYVNNYKDPSKPAVIFDERGYRSNLCDIVKAKTGIIKGVYHKEDEILYLSAHTRFQAIDFDVQGCLAEEIRSWIKNHQKEMPVPIRLEKDVKWVHMDVCAPLDSYDKVTYF